MHHKRDFEILVLRDFVKNFDDMSDQNGFSFKFKCDICGDGFLTKYRPAPYAKAKGFLGAASSLGSSIGSSLGGFGGGAWGAQSAAGYMQDAKWREAYEKALDEGIAEARAHFTKCPGCTRYVDSTCWNEQALMCVDCSPRQAITVQKARAAAFGTKAQEAMMAQDYSAEIKGAETVKVTCSNCGKPTSSGKFCEVCGAPLEKNACPNCGASISATARFCNNCGAKLAAPT
jgi:rRNA maturation endonuclease Nob1